MSFRWIRFLHIAAAIGFVGIHGASIVVLYAIRGERDRGRVEAILDFSAGTATAMYVALVAVVGTGLWMGFERSRLFREGWYWWSLLLLVATSVLMWFVAKPFTKRVRAACEMRPSGVPRVSDEELTETLRSPRTHLITGIGVVGLVAILYLMVFQPTLSSTSAPTAETTLPAAATGTTTLPDGDQPLLVLGKEIFDVSAGGTGCAECHGFDGRGTADADDITGSSKSAIAEALDEEREMRDIDLTAEELEAVYRYLQTLP